MLAIRRDGWWNGSQDMMLARVCPSLHSICQIVPSTLDNIVWTRISYLTEIGSNDKSSESDKTSKEVNSKGTLQIDVKFALSSVSSLPRTDSKYLLIVASTISQCIPPGKIIHLLPSMMSLKSASNFLYLESFVLVFWVSPLASSILRALVTRAVSSKLIEVEDLKRTICSLYASLLTMTQQEKLDLIVPHEKREVDVFIIELETVLLQGLLCCEVDNKCLYKL